MEQINGQSLKEMLRSGMNNLKNHSAQIDALNVFEDTEFLKDLARSLTERRT